MFATRHFLLRDLNAVLTSHRGQQGPTLSRLLHIYIQYSVHRTLQYFLCGKYFMVSHDSGLEIKIRIKVTIYQLKHERDASYNLTKSFHC